MQDSQIEISGNLCRIRISEAQLNQREDIFHILDSLIEKSSPTKVILDCGDIQRINSNGIGRMVYLRRYLMDEKNVSSEFTNINPHILKTLKSVKVDHLLGLDS